MGPNGDDAPPSPLTFSGSRAEDVTIFIQNVQKVAYAQGRQRDDDWRTDYLTTCLNGDALLFFSQLDEEDQYSFKRLRLALLQKFGKPFAPEPPAAAVGPPNASAVSRSHRRGYLRVVNCSTLQPCGYLPRHIPGSWCIGSFQKTTTEALIVEIPSRMTVGDTSRWRMKMVNPLPLSDTDRYLGPKVNIDDNRPCFGVYDESEIRDDLASAPWAYGVPRSVPDGEDELEPYTSRMGFLWIQHLPNEVGDFLFLHPIEGSRSSNPKIVKLLFIPV